MGQGGSSTASGSANLRHVNFWGEADGGVEDLPGEGVGVVGSVICHDELNAV